jgi:hypothetical protein
MLTKFSSGNLKGKARSNNHLKVIGFVLKCIIHYEIWKRVLYSDGLKYEAMARSYEHHNGCEFWVSPSSDSEISVVLLRNAVSWGEDLTTLRRHYFRNVGSCCTERHSVTSQKPWCSWQWRFSSHKRRSVCWVSELVSCQDIFYRDQLVVSEFLACKMLLRFFLWQQTNMLTEYY